MTIKQWCEVTFETGHATGMPKTGHAIRYFMGSSLVGHAIFYKWQKKFSVRF